MADLFGDTEPQSGAIISPCGLYRYHLWRIWEPLQPVMCFVMQNPSTADATEDDATIRRCVGFAKREGCGGISVRNVFAYRATDEKELLKCSDPVGPENEKHLLAARNVSLLTQLVVAWGTPFGGPRLRNYYKNASTICVVQDAYCLGTTKDGHPRHPLFVRGDQPLERFVLR